MRSRRHILSAALLGLGLPAAALAQSEIKLVAATRQAGDEFGIMCVTSGNLVVVGARNDDQRAADAGAVYVFERSGSGWAQVQKLTASDGAAGDQLGGIISLDGHSEDRMFVGALRDDVNGLRDAGSVYVFERLAGTWTEVAKLVCSDPSADAFFGNAIDSDGTHVMVGALGKNALRGAVYVFAEQDPVGFVQVAKLIASDGAPDDRFGDAVAVHGDTAVIGAPGDDGTGTFSGSAYLFQLVAGVWSQGQKIVPQDVGPTDNFASAVDISADRFVAGAREHGSRGAVYVYERDSANDWIPEAKLVAANGAVSDFFGHDVRMDGERIVIGAVGHLSSRGIAYMFDLADSGWAETAQLQASDGQPGDFLGHSVAIHGRVTVLGARGDDQLRGAAYVYEEPLTVSATASTVDVSPSEVEVGQQAMVTVTPRADDGSLMGAGLAVEISTSLGSLSGVALDVGDGTYTQVIETSEAGTAEISAVADGVQLEATATLSVVDPASTIGSVVGVLADGTLLPYDSIQSAVDAAEADALLRILVPPGEYDEVVEVRRVEGLSIEGLVSFGPVVVRGFRFARSGRVAVAGFEVRDQDGQRHGVVLRGGRLRNHDVVLSDLLVHGGSRRCGSGIHVGPGNQRVTIVNCRVENVAGDGISMASSGRGHAITGCVVRGNGHNGIRLGHHVTVTISGCEIADNGQRGRHESGYGIVRQRSACRHAKPEMVTLIGNLISGNRGRVQRGKSDHDLGNYDQMLDPTDQQPR